MITIVVRIRTLAGMDRVNQVLPIQVLSAAARTRHIAVQREIAGLRPIARAARQQQIVRKITTHVRILFNAFQGDANIQTIPAPVTMA